MSQGSHKSIEEVHVMRKISFDEETVKTIRKYIEDGHTLAETCNRFTLKMDTLRRVMRENNIICKYGKKSHISSKIFDDNYVVPVTKLFKFTDTRLHDICKECKVEYWELQEILKNNFTQVEIDSRKSRLYRLSKLGNKNPMKNQTGEKHHGYKGLIEDGNGYLQIKKPHWYTGRKGSEYIFYHSYVMCINLGITEIPRGFVVHHIDGNKKNNDISNLALVTISGHGKLHSIQRNLCKVQRLSDNGVGSDSETPNNGFQKKMKPSKI